MNWARGLFRLWLVLSILWIGAVAWMERDRLCWAPAPVDRRVDAAFTAGPFVLARLDETVLEDICKTVTECLPGGDQAHAWWRAREPVLLILFGPPVAAFVLGALLLW